MEWGLLAIEDVPSSRRRLTLGLSSAIRRYNEAAVPNLGGLWFIRQAALALLGIRVAEEARERGMACANITVANAVEALACRLAYDKVTYSDPRLRGGQKLQRLEVRGADYSYGTMSPGSAYVSQPHRMGTVRALPALGLVNTTGARFNAFHTNAAGRELIDAVFGAPYQGFNVLRSLTQWVRGEVARPRPMVCDALDPTGSVAKAGPLIRDAVVAGCGPRGAAILEWMDKIDAPKVGSQPHGDWSDKPDVIDPEHWRDLEAGALLLEARAAAVGVLKAIEVMLSQTQERRLALSGNNLNGSMLEHATYDWQEAARRYIDHLKENGDDTFGAAHDGGTFCREALLERSNALKHLIRREGYALRVVDEEVVATMRFEPTEEPDASDPLADEDGGINDVNDDTEVTPLPPNVSPRVRQLRRLALDMNGRLGELLFPEQKDAA